MRLSSVREDIVALLNEKANVGKSKETPLLSEFSRDLTEAAARGALDPLVGREDELERVVQVLCRRTRNNPVLIGEPGVGKTALVEGPRQQDRAGRRARLPRRQADPRPRHLADRGRHEVPRPVRGAAQDDHEGAHREPRTSSSSSTSCTPSSGAGSAEGSLDAANILKPALSRGEIQCIGATTPVEYRKHIEKDRALERRFQTVKVALADRGGDGPDPARAQGRATRSSTTCSYQDEALEAAVYQSSRYIADRFLPDKAIDLLDEAGSRVKLREAAVHRWRPRRFRDGAGRGRAAARP